PLAFGTWTVLFPLGRRYALVGALACAAAAAWTLVRSRGLLEEGRARATLAILPLFLVPLVALARNPSVFGVMAFGIVAAGVRVVHARAGAALGRITTVAPIVVGSSFVAMLTMPLRFRELDSVNLHDHEAMHEAWVNSAVHGKWLTVDASTAYGPLREY